MRKDLSIFLINVHSDRNSGDLALSRVTISQLYNVFPGCRIIISINDYEGYQGGWPAVKSLVNWLKNNSKWNAFRLLLLLPATLLPIISKRILNKACFFLTPIEIREWIEILINSDLVVSTAGGYLYSSGRGIALLVSLYILYMVILAQKPLYFFPQSYGSFNHTWEKILFRFVLNKARIIMARDPISFNNLMTCKINSSKCLLVPDVAFSLEGKTQAEAKHWLESRGVKKNTKLFMGMTVIDWKAANPLFSNQDQYEKAIIAAIKHFITNLNGIVIIFPQTLGPSKAEDDRIVAQKIIQNIDRNHLYNITEPIQPELLQALFGEMDLFVGTRMHSNIFAMTRYVPVIPIGYQHKSLGIAKMLGLQEWVIDINSVNENILIEKINRACVNLDQIRNYLKVIIPNIARESSKSGEYIARDFQAHYQEDVLADESMTNQSAKEME